MSDNITVKKETWDFFLYSYFGIFSKNEENDDEKMFKCAQRAYRDLNRTLEFDDNLKDKAEKKRNEAIKAEFARRVSKYIVDQIIDLKSNTECNLNGVIDKTLNKMKDMQFKYADCWHNVLKGKDTYFGQAQKWVNMTIKYMWLIGLWNDEMPMDVPVDSYIMEAAAGRNYRDKDLCHEGYKIELPCRDEVKRRLYREDDKGTSPKAWSQWNDKEYKDFQEKFKEKIVEKVKANPNGPQTLLGCENQAWIEIAEKRNKRISFESMRNVKHDDNVIVIE